MKCLLLGLLVACKSSSDTKPPPSTPPPPRGDAAAVNSTLVPEPAAADLCDAYDRSAVVEIFGWKGMQKVSANGLKNGERRERHCAYRAMDDAFKDATFGIAFSTDVSYLPRHAGYEITYDKRGPLGQVASWYGENKDIVSVQIQDEHRRVRIITTLAKSGTPEEMKPKIIAATAKLLATMPADPLPMMHK